VRRRFNDAVLKAVYLEDGKVKRAEFTDLFATLFSRPSSNKWVKGCPRQCPGSVPPAACPRQEPNKRGATGSVRTWKSVLRTNLIERGMRSWSPVTKGEIVSPSSP
jgi:hypothetical protein